MEWRMADNFLSSVDSFWLLTTENGFFFLNSFITKYVLIFLNIFFNAFKKFYYFNEFVKYFFLKKYSKNVYPSLFFFFYFN